MMVRPTNIPDNLITDHKGCLNVRMTPAGSIFSASIGGDEARKFARLLYETPCVSLKRKQQTANRIMQQPLTGIKQSPRGGKRIEFR
jgi:hypothetical protein